MRQAPAIACAALRRAGPRPLRRRPRRRPRPLVVAAELDLAALRARARAGTLPALFSGLVRVPAGAAAARAARWPAASPPLPEAEREALVLELVRGRGRRRARPRLRRRGRPRAAFKDLGFDSLAAVELRNRLGAATGLRLPATVVFDYPNAAGARRRTCSQRGDGERRRRAPRRHAPRPQRGADRDRRHGLPLPGRGRLPRGALAAGRRGPRRDRRFPADRGWDLERLYDPDPERPRHQLRPRGRLPRRRRRLRRRLLRHQPARGAGDGPPAAAAAGSRLGGAGGRRHRPARPARQRRPASSPGSMYHGLRRRGWRARA